MGRYTGPKLKIIRRLGVLPGLTRKEIKNRILSPGQHGKKKLSLLKQKRFSLSDDYKYRLIEKQKVRYNYGIRHKQLTRYYKLSKAYKGITGYILLNFLESRLDCLLYRIGFAKTIPSARQFINHCHVFVNNKKVNIPSFFCQKKDTISLKKNSKIRKLVRQTYKFFSEKRSGIKKRMKQVNYTKMRAGVLLPDYLKVNTNLLIAKIIGKIKRKDISLKINEQKIIEYYSR
jgi:small subunit ribosomal protein S4